MTATTSQSLSPEEANRERKPDRSDGVLGRRVLAFVADTAVVVAATLTVVPRLAASRGRRAAAAGLAAAIGGLVYHVVFEGAFGRTPGKRLAGVVVVRENGGPCTFTAAGVRTVFRLVDWLPAGYLLGLAAIALTDRGQRVGDLAAGTVVVRARTRR